LTCNDNDVETESVHEPVCNPFSGTSNTHSFDEPAKGSRIVGNVYQRA